MMRMIKKKWMCLFVVVLFALGLFPVISEAEEKRVYDQAALFTEEKVSALEMDIASLRAETTYDFVIVSTDDAQGKSARDYADDFYDENGFGTGQDKSGVLLLLDMDNREIWISTSGRMIDILTDKRIEDILDNVYAKMTDADYAGAADMFLKDAKYYIEQGIPAGQYRETLKETKPISKTERAIRGLSMGLVFGAIVSGISCLVIVLRYKGKRGQGEYAYQQAGNMQLTKQNDIFLSKHVTRRKIPKNPPAGNSSKRSSVHTSGSGRTHGGGGRKF